MKNVITILMLIVAIIAGGVTAEAKTTKKAKTIQKAKKTSTTQSSTFNLKTLTSKLYNKNSDVFQVSISQLNSVMKELGFSTMGVPVSSSVYNDIDDSYEHATAYCYNKGSLIAIVFVNDYGNLKKITIMFPSESEASAFVSSSKSALGSALRGGPTEYYYSKGICIWIMNQFDSFIDILLEEDMG